MLYRHRNVLLPRNVEVREMAGGRPSKYKAEYAEQAYKFCLLGATDARLAEFFEVDEATIHRWKHDHKEFCDSIKRGKEVADAEVAASLYKRANGYQYDEQTQEIMESAETGKQRLVVTKIVTKEIAPDTGAAMAWLKNRQPQQWRDKQDIESVNTNMNTDLTNLTPEERRARIDELNRKRGIGTA
jgi:hypothetical protein